MKHDNVIAVIDMRAFYSYVECVERGLDPYTTPLVVADKTRGTNTIVLSVTPYLKRKGIPSRLRIKELPKHINYIYAEPRMSLYLKRSSEVFSIILDFISEEDLHIYSVDECFINLTPYLKLYKCNPYQLVKKIKQAIMDKTKLECTIGIGDNMFLAKVALDHYAKKEKDGIATLKIDEIKEKLWSISPLNDIWGIGSNLQRRLNALGIYTVKDLANSNKDYLRKYLGIIGEELIDHANGIDESNIREKYIPKETSLTLGQTLFEDYNIEKTKLLIKELCDDLMMRLRLENKMTKCVHLYVGYSKSLGGFSSQTSLLKYSDKNDDIYEALISIFNKKVLDLPIRKLSIALTKLKDNDGVEQLDLFTNYETMIKEKRLQLTIDNIQSRYGKNAVLRTSSLLDFSTIKERHTYIGGHKR